jgi:hypothetical protein
MNDVHCGQHDGERPQPLSAERTATTLCCCCEHEPGRRDDAANHGLHMWRTPDEHVLAEGGVIPDVDGISRDDDQGAGARKREAEWQPQASEAGNRAPEILEIATAREDERHR